MDITRETLGKDITRQDIPASAQELEQLLRELIKGPGVMLFMKGRAEQPRCGFSAHVVTILDQLGTPYSTFNILENPAVRQGLKEFSNWPTYPQLYIHGELIGGDDIVTELFQSGELAQLVQTPGPS